MNSIKYSAHMWASIVGEGETVGKFPPPPLFLGGEWSMLSSPQEITHTKAQFHLHYVYTKHLFKSEGADVEIA